MEFKSAIQWYIFGILAATVWAVNQEDHSGDIIGKECKLTEPIYNTQFDLNQLHSELGHKVNGEDGDFIEFNVCGNLTKPCAGSDSVAACFHKNGKEYKIGSEADGQPIYTNGRLYFNLKGDICKKEKNESYTLMIIMTCDYSSHISNPIILMPYSDDQCVLVLMWRSRFACHPLSAPLNSNTCTAKDPRTNHVFNLMPLSELNHRIPYRPDIDFIINVCKPVLYMHNEMCPPESSVCLANTTETDLKKKFVNYGTTVIDPIFENNELFMRLPSNVKCNATHNYESTIDFVCDKSITLGEPELLTDKNCQYSFTWATSLACNSIPSCRVIDPITGFVYDLNSLAGKQYKVQQGADTYVFGVCSSAKKPCLENTGACLTTNGQSTSLGAMNNQLHLLDETNAPFLMYESGSVCESLHKQWTTKIEFVCQTEGVAAGPKIIENTNCSLIIQFATKAVCHTSIQCKAYDYESDRELDLSPLMSASNNYLASISDALKSKEPEKVLYYLNVCRPLVPQYGLSCAGNSAACRAINGTITPEQEESLGYADISLTIVKTEHGARPQLKYLRGSTCPKDPLTKLSSQIEFYCDAKAGKGTPILEEILHGCHYVFQWPTNVICPTHDGEFREKTCEIYNNQLEKAFDLRTIFKDGIVNVKYNNAPIELNVCKNNKKIETDYAQSTVKVFFDAKAPCGTTDTINVEMRLVCKETESLSFTKDTQSCGLVYIKETPLICPQLAITINNTTMPIVITADANKGHAPIRSDMKILGAVLLTSAFVALILAVVFTIKDPERRNRIMSLFRKRNVTVRYSRVRSNEEANLLLEQPGSLSDSDEDLII